MYIPSRFIVYYVCVSSPIVKRLSVVFDDINIINTIIMQNVAFVNKKFVAWFFLNKNKSRYGFWVDMMTMTVMNVNPNVNWFSHWQRRIDGTILNENMDALARAIDFHWTIVRTIWIMNRTYFLIFSSNQCIAHL